jgi:hypothetical protein
MGQLATSITQSQVVLWVAARDPSRQGLWAMDMWAACRASNVFLRGETTNGCPEFHTIRNQR